MPRLLRQAIATAVLLLVLAGAGVLLLRSTGAPVAIGPSPTPTPPITASASAPSPSQAAQPSPTQRPRAVYRQIEADVRRLRGLPDAGLGPPELISREQLAIELERILDKDFPPAEAARDNRTLRALGLLTEEQDIRELTQQLLSGQVLGFYDFDRRRMVIVSDAGLDAIAKVTYAHEYTHALQDAAFDTGAGHRATEGEDDAALARLCLEEGDATWLMSLWARDHLSLPELLGLGQMPAPDTTGIPPWMLRQLELPYVAGLSFVRILWSESASFRRVDAAFRHPPSSTEQILHSDKYRSGEDPMPVAAPALVAALERRSGDGWRVNEETTLGEALVAIWLEHLGVVRTAADEAAAGWGGDRISVAFRGSDEWALAWRLAWDSEADATAFAEAYATARLSLNGPARLVRLSSRVTLVVQASSADVLEAAATAR